MKKVALNKHIVLDLWFICTYEMLISLVIVIFHFKFYQSTLLFFIAPSIFLIVRKTKKLSHILLASIGGLGLGFVFDFFGTFNHAWYIPTSQLLIHQRIFGEVSFDDLLWFFGYMFFITVFYEHFLDQAKKKKISSHIFFALFLSLGLLIVISSLFRIAPQLLQFKFAYLLDCLAILPFFIFMLYHKPSLLITYLKLTLFFGPVSLLFELTALTNNQWIFPGQYIGHIELFGLIMPFEEFFFWILLSSSVVLSYYEFFVKE